MISHSDIWRGIDRLATSFGYSPSGLAKKAGLDPTSFNKSKRVSSDGKPRWPSTESISRILQATGSTMTDFIALIGKDDAAREKVGTRRIPVIGLAQAGRKGYFDSDGYPAGDGWDEAPFPDNRSNDENTYALKITGSSMEPLYRAGDLLIISPSARVKRGDRVVVRTKDGEVMAKELVRQSANKIELKSLNPDHENINFSASQVNWMARIMWVSQ
jgi:phage repressor protein C with HTH and peptisase S24 domain